MRYYPVKLQRNLCAVSVRVLTVKVCALCLFALCFLFLTLLPHWNLF